MSQTYTTRRDLFGNLTNNSAAATLAIADVLLNVSEKRIISARDWDFLWRQYTKETVATEQSIKLPAYTYKPQSIYVTVGSYRYTPCEVTNRDDWDRLNSTSVTSDAVTHYFVYDGAIELYPIPATSSSVVTFNARRKAKDLTIPDTSGSGVITDIATTGVVTTITQSDTDWGTGMIGQHIKITSTNAALGGDGMWYEIATVPTASTLTLVKTYGGTEITGAVADYTMGELSLIPEPHDTLPVYEALKIYYASVDPDVKKSELYAKMYIESYDQMVRDHGSKMNVVVDDGTGQYGDEINPNLQVTL